MESYSALSTCIVLHLATTAPKHTIMWSCWWIPATCPSAGSQPIPSLAEVRGWVRFQELGPARSSVTGSRLFHHTGCLKTRVSFSSIPPKSPLPLGHICCKLSSFHEVNKLIVVHSLLHPPLYPILAVPRPPTHTPPPRQSNAHQVYTSVS